MSAFAKVLLDDAAGRIFDYQVPEPWIGEIAVGSRVRVPLKTRTLLGTVIELLEETSTPGLRPISERVDSEPSVPPRMLDLARWISNYYLAPLPVSLRAVLPRVIRAAEMRHRELRVVRLVAAPDAEAREKLSRRAPRQAEILDYLAEKDAPVVAARLLDETGAADSTLKSLEKQGWISITSEISERDPTAGTEFLATEPLRLNAEQEAALAAVLEAMAAPAEAKPVLLHGVTGSGKTEIYLQAIRAALDEGGTALVLVPEISLTPQTVERFKSRFADRQREVAVLHSHLSEGERHDEWRRIRSGKAQIVIGARSAVFAPLDRLKLIVVDEEHEGSYKQEEAPRYHARDVAVVRAKMEGSAILLGSATPSMESWQNALAGKYRLVQFLERVDSRSMPLVRVLDMRLQKRTREDDGVLAPIMRMAIDARLQKGEQTILFLNRRGFSSSLLCQACGYVAMCPQCSVTLTYHRQDERLICHICGHSERTPEQCPSCKAPGIRFQGFGTQKVEETVRRTFRDARVARMDHDSMTRKHAYRETLDAFKMGKIDILIGTQMIAKGLDFPNVTLVGIVNADLSLHLPDFRAGERTFQLITQVAGRAGRGTLEGEVLVQSFTPHSPSIQYARRHDFNGFFEEELEFRRQFDFPPYSRMIVVTIRSESLEKAEFFSRSLGRRLKEVVPEKSLLGEPAPAPLARAKGFYRFQVIMRSHQIRRLTGPLKNVLEAFTLPDDVSLSVDVDAFNLL